MTEFHQQLPFHSHRKISFFLCFSSMSVPVLLSPQSLLQNHRLLLWHLEFWRPVSTVDTGFLTRVPTSLTHHGSHPVLKRKTWTTSKSLKHADEEAQFLLYWVQYEVSSLLCTSIYFHEHNHLFLSFVLERKIPLRLTLTHSATHSILSCGLQTILVARFLFFSSIFHLYFFTQRGDWSSWCAVSEGRWAAGGEAGKADRAGRSVRWVLLLELGPGACPCSF